MKLVMIINRIKLTDQIYVESINIEKTDLQNYLNWLTDSNSNPFILATKEIWTVESLRDYINKQNQSDSTLLIGIFDYFDGKHIGNIKFENVYQQSKNCSFGILIGEKNFRNIGIGTTVITKTISYLSSEFEILEFFLGVDKLNENAIKTYSKIGFKFLEESGTDGSLRMSIKL